VADMFGVKPLPVEAPLAERLITLVEAERAKGVPQPVLGPLPATSQYSTNPLTAP